MADIDERLPGETSFGGLAQLSIMLLAVLMATPVSLPEFIPPAAQYVHPFNGNVMLMNLPRDPASPLWALSHHEAGLCQVWLPYGDPTIQPRIKGELLDIEIANCNGGPDLNWRRTTPQYPAISRQESPGKGITVASDAGSRDTGAAAGPRMMAAAGDTVIGAAARTRESGDPDASMARGGDLGSGNDPLSRAARSVP